MTGAGRVKMAGYNGGYGLFVRMMRDRGFDRKVAEKFGMGFAPRGGEELTRHAQAPLPTFGPPFLGQAHTKGMAHAPAFAELDHVAAASPVIEAKVIHAPWFTAVRSMKTASTAHR